MSGRALPFHPSDYTVLVVDDDDALRGALLWDLKRKGFQTLEAENGEVAFQKVQANKVHLVLTDIRMPVCDGIELLRRLKDQNLDLPIVMFISGFSDLTPEEASDQGAEAVFTKPFDRKCLLATIEAAVKTKADRWSQPLPGGAGSQIELNGRFNSIETASSNHTFNLGRGGFYINCKPAEAGVVPNGTVTFRIEFTASTPSLLEGAGRVLWTRAEPDSDGHPRGAGVEILQLSAPCLSPILQWIEAQKPRAWVPRG
jgi:DNA-binding response OmpR family regulator